jgi:hypothetical protein
MKIMRFAGAAGVAAEAKRRNPSDSRNGSAMSPELERRKWRRVFMEMFD